MELLIIAVAVILIGMLAVEANVIGVDSRDTFNTEPTGIS